VRIIVDLQWAQVDFKFGKNESDALNLTKELAKVSSTNLYVVLNGLFSEQAIAIRRELKNIVPVENIQTFLPPEMPSGSMWHVKVGELIREYCVLNFNPDVVLVPGRVISDGSGVVFSSGMIGKAVPTIVGLLPEEIGNFTDSTLVSSDNMLAEHDMPLSERVDSILKSCHEKLSEFKEEQLSVLINERPKLAFVSPLPPLKSGISFYSIELLPALSQYYDIDVIVSQESVTDKWTLDNCSIRTPEYLLGNKHRYSRVMYQVGNSPFHSYMFDLIEHVPGVVVLHDFYLGDLAYYMERHENRTNWFTRELYHSHGFHGLVDCYSNGDLHETLREYPMNFRLFEQSSAVIVHSSYAQQCATKFYGSKYVDQCYRIPLLRQSTLINSDENTREILGIESNDMLVCCMGHLEPHKLNVQIIDAWIASELGARGDCKLVFVGSIGSDDFAKEIESKVKNRDDITITGWVDDSTYQNYLSEANIAVQLRGKSRGETSAAVLDCMNYGVATIVNSSGSMDELSERDVYKLGHTDDEGGLLSQIIVALNELANDNELREALGEHAQQTIFSKHSPVTCAKQYSEIIEKCNISHLSTEVLAECIANLEWQSVGQNDLVDLASRIAQSDNLGGAKKQLFVDVTVVAKDDMRTGIQRVVRSIVGELIAVDLDGYRVEPVYLSDLGGRWHYRYARQWTAKTYGCSEEHVCDDQLEYASGDILLIADFTSTMLSEVIDNSDVYKTLSLSGVTVKSIVYDLLPITLPDFFPGHSTYGHKRWIDSVFKLDGAICISRSVAEELRLYSQKNLSDDPSEFPIDWFHLGADINASSPSKGLPENYLTVINKIKQRVSFLMVGTVEPRKGHAFTLDAFEILWSEGLQFNLVVVGKEGWDVPALATRIKSHPELNKRLFWLEAISDEYLEKIYSASSCLIAASEGEGFGLPLIEAAQYKLPIIARDIPIFREVAGEYAFYFDGEKSAELSSAIHKWVLLFENEEHQKSDEMPWLTWAGSANALIEVLFDEDRG
jgi:glycosyltransferase involved in cell wall biosynthesis